MVAVLTAIPVALALSLAACGGDGNGDQLSLEEYFQRLEILGEELDEAIAPLTETMSTSEDAEELKTALSEYSSLLEAFLADLDELSPPEEAESAHEEGLSNGRAFLSALDDLVGAAEDVETVEELSQLPESEAADAASGAFTESCLALQGIADESGIGVDLRCE